MRFCFLLGLGGALLAGCLPGPAALTQTPTVTARVSTATPFPAASAPTAVPTPPCADVQGTWTDFHYTGAVVPDEIPAKAYLPPCYDENAERYPVAYFFHGKPYTETEWLDLGLAELVDPDSGEKAVSSMILVLARLPEPIFSGTDGGPGSYETEFIDGLVASVDQAFRTEPGAAGRAVVGISRGGVWALEIGFRHPDQIGAVAALSPALAVNHARPDYDPMRLAVVAPALPSELLLIAGDADWARQGTEDLASALEQRGTIPILIIVPGAHGDSTWTSVLPEVLGFLSAAFAAPDPDLGIPG